MACDHFWREIVGRAAESSLQVAFETSAGETEIGNLGAAALRGGAGEEDVLWFHVTMDDVPTVEVFKTVADVDEEAV